MNHSKKSKVMLLIGYQKKNNPKINIQKIIFLEQIYKE